VDGLGSFGNARHWVKLLSNVLMKLRVEWDGLVTQAITATEIGNKTHVVVEVLEHVLQLGWACALDLPAIMAMPLARRTAEPDMQTRGRISQQGGNEHTQTPPSYPQSKTSVGRRYRAAVRALCCEIEMDAYWQLSCFSK
jgi:hypothetical protein